jgi:hypothetical protein
MRVATSCMRLIHFNVNRLISAYNNLQPQRKRLFGSYQFIKRRDGVIPLQVLCLYSKKITQDNVDTSPCPKRDSNP